MLAVCGAFIAKALFEQAEHSRRVHILDGTQFYRVPIHRSTPEEEKEALRLQDEAERSAAAARQRAHARVLAWRTAGWAFVAADIVLIAVVAYRTTIR